MPGEDDAETGTEAAFGPKKRASCTSVESSSPGIGASLGGDLSLRKRVRSLWAVGEEDGVGVGEGVVGMFAGIW